MIGPAPARLGQNPVAAGAVAQRGMEVTITQTLAIKKLEFFFKGGGRTVKDSAG